MRNVIYLPVCAFLSVATVHMVSCRALESVDKVEKSTAEVGEKMDKTNNGIDRTNRKMDETNGSIDETNHKMDDVRRQMNDMNDKLVETNKRMDNMNRALDRMYQDLRQGDSLNARLKTVEKLIAAPKLKSKTLYAAQYFMSFEYQLWKGEGTDGEQARQVLMQCAMDEFVQLLRQLTSSELPLNVVDESDRQASLHALAISMHLVNANSELSLQGRNLALESMHDLLRHSLKYGYQLQQSKISVSDIPKYAQLALKEPDLVRYIFELRVNMFPAVVVSSLSDSGSDDFLTRWSSRAGVWLNTWNARTGPLNELQLREYAQWMAWANEDVLFLKSLGIRLRVDSTLLRSLRNMRIYEAQARNSESASAVSRTNALNTLKIELGNYLAQVDSE